MIIERVWAMPNSQTFLIKPIAKLISEEMSTGGVWFDPFAGFNSPASLKNDLNPKAPTQSHVDAHLFIKRLQSEYDGCLFDPPYNKNQAKICYQSFGVTPYDDWAKYFFAYEKDLIAPRIKVGGKVICCGWNSGGMGINRGFELTRILLVPHGGAHNDTIVTVEKKIETNSN